MKTMASRSSPPIVALYTLLVVNPASTWGQRGSPTQAGSFTREQVERGGAVYARSCAACHGDSLSGGSAIALTGASFQSRWSHPDMKDELSRNRTQCCDTLQEMQKKGG